MVAPVPTAFPDDEPDELTLVEDRPLVAMGLRAALAGVPEAAGLVVVGRTEHPLAAVRSAVQRGQRVVLVLDVAGQMRDADLALDAGALGVALLDGGVTELLDVVRAAHDGRRRVAAALLARQEERDRLLRLFTPRERQVLALYVTGIPAKSVARQMAVSAGTAKTYLKRLREKGRAHGLAVATKVDLAALARRMGIW